MKKIITPRSRFNILTYIKTIWGYRFFSYSFAVGEIKNKYAKNSFGFFYSILQVSITLVVYWAIFGIILNVNAGGISYPLFALSGIVFWQYFSSTVSNMGSTLYHSQNIVNKMYFPRINLLISQLFVNIPDMLIGIMLYILIFMFSDESISISIFYSIIIFIILIITTFGIGLWVCIISLYHKNIGEILVQLIQFSFFLTPVFYPGTIIPGPFKVLLYMNPIASIIEFFRNSLFEIYPYDKMFFIGIFIGLSLLIIGFIYFMRLEKKITNMF